MSKKPKDTEKYNDIEKEAPSFPETNGIKVIGDLSEYAREYLMQLKPKEEQDVILKVVEDGTKVSDKDYIEIGALKHTAPSAKPYLYITAETLTPEIDALSLYAVGRGMTVIYSLDELAISTTP